MQLSKVLSIIALFIALGALNSVNIASASILVVCGSKGGAMVTEKVPSGCHAVTTNSTPSSHE
jgi:hypothetical protein